MIMTKDTLPVGWRWVRIGDICEVATGGTPDTNHPEYYGGSICWLKSGDIKGDYIDEIPNRISQLGLDNSNARVHPSGSVMLAMSGQGKTRGTSSILRTPSACSQSVAAILPSSEAIPEIIHFALVNRYDETRRLTGDNERTGLNLKLIRDIQIPLPPFSEQKRITERLKEQLAAVAQGRKSAEEQLRAARKLQYAYLREVFDNKLAQECSLKTIEDVCSFITDGTHVTPTYTLTGIPFLSVKDIKESGLCFESCQYISDEEHKLLTKHCKPERGDVLYTKVGTTGIAKSVDIDREFSIFVSVALLKVKPEIILSEYMERALNSPFCRIQAKALTQGMANRNLVIKDLKRIVLPVPTISEQTQINNTITNKLSIMEDLRKIVESQLMEITSLPLVLLREAFQGDR
jgi:type I restriction enzyme S subunit